MRNDQGGPAVAGDDVGHGEGLAGAGNAQKGLEFIATFEALGQLPDGLGLVAPGLVIGVQFEFGHDIIIYNTALPS